MVFPVPREIADSAGDFVLDEQVAIAVPQSPSSEDLFLANFLADELGGLFGLHLRIQKTESLNLPGRRIVIGSISNPLVRDYCASHRLAVNPRDPGAEGYLLQADSNIVLVAGSDERGVAPHDWEQNSTHQDIADGDILEKKEVADLAEWVKRYHIELIPELPSFAHSYYLLTEHKELSEVPGVKWPGVYCPSNPESYKLLFDSYDEYLDLLKPRMVHAGHDELFQPVGLCSKCKGKDIRELYGQDVRTIPSTLLAKVSRWRFEITFFAYEWKNPRLGKKSSKFG